MQKLTAKSPTRVDLAGGTLDIWPLNLLVDRAMTVNVAIDLWARAEIESLDDAGRNRIEVRSADQDIQETWEAATPPPDSRLPLVAQCVRLFGPETGFRLTARCEAPSGSGLGGSSALAISLLGGLQKFLGAPIMPPEEMVSVARDLEARVLGIPTGTQDHMAAVFGGAMAISYGPGTPVRESLSVDLEKLGERMVLVYSGASRASGVANWDMVRRAIEKDRDARDRLAAIAAVAHEMRAALNEGDLDAVGPLVHEEWTQRRGLSPQVSTPLTDKVIETARSAGALAGKACGAGGGGCIVLYCAEGRREAVAAAMGGLQPDGVSVLEARPTRTGLQLVG